MNQDIENIIKKWLKKHKDDGQWVSDYDGEFDLENCCLDGDFDLNDLADEVLKVVKLEIEKDLSHDANHFCKKYGEQFKECAMCYFERKLLSEHLSHNKENK